MPRRFDPPFIVVAIAAAIAIAALIFGIDALRRGTFKSEPPQSAHDACVSAAERQYAECLDGSCEGTLKGRVATRAMLICYYQHARGDQQMVQRLREADAYDFATPDR